MYAWFGETSVLSVFSSDGTETDGSSSISAVTSGSESVEQRGAGAGCVACFAMKSVELVSEAQVDRREVLVLKPLP